MIDVLALLKAHNIPYREAGEHRHASTGWVQVCCPQCDQGKGFHCGIHLDFGNCNCWRCGKLDRLDVFASLLGSRRAAVRALRQYTTEGMAAKPQKIRHAATCTLPSEAGPLQDRHKRYLRGRGFDAEELEDLWDLKGTGRHGRMRFRVLAPIYLDRVLCSYQGRDVTGKAKAPYLPCRAEDEARPHKHCLYGLDMVPGRSVVVVEGIVDVWRIGPGAVATFGTGWSREQAQLLADRMDFVYVLFDPEAEAQTKADSLADVLDLAGVNVEVWEQEEGADPGELDEEDIKNIKDRAKI